MILIAIGSNIAGPWGDPRETVARAIAALDHKPLRLLRASALIVTRAFGREDQPPYINAVARVKTRLAPLDLLHHLRELERQAGRRRRERWGPRTLDLDILDYDGRIVSPGASDSTQAELVLPHPGIAERSFVLEPLREIAPRWRHPLTGRTAAVMLAALTGARDTEAKTPQHG